MRTKTNSLMASWLVVGLGNPGPTYAFTRHNVGFLVVDELASRARVSLKRSRTLAAHTATTRIGSAGLGAPAIDAVPVHLACPTTYMNNSGRAVAALSRFYKVRAENIIVVHDEIDLDFQTMRCKFGGGDNGHNGLRSIRSHLGTGDYYRIRFGVGRPPGRQDAADYVLAPIPKSLAADYEVEVSRVTDAVETLITQGLAIAQNRYNS